MSNESYENEHKLVIDITQSQFKQLRQICPHGTKKLLFQSLIEFIFDLYEEQGFPAIMRLIRQQDVNFQELLRYDRAEKRITKTFMSQVSEFLTLVGEPKRPLTTYSECIEALNDVYNILKKEYKNANG